MGLLLYSLVRVTAFGTPVPETIPATPVLGQLLAQGAQVDGVSVPEGTTLLNGSQVSTGDFTTSVHLINGQVVELGTHSSAVFRRIASGEIEVTVGSGSLRFRGEDGNLRVAGPSDRVQFAQRRAGQPIYENQQGVVGVLAERAARGQRQLVLEDAAKVEPTGQAVIKAYGGDRQELVCNIEQIRDREVTLTEDLRFSYQPRDLVLQRFPVASHGAVGVLTREADEGDDLLRVDDARRVNPLERIEIRHPSRPVREVACVRYTQASPSGPAPGTAADAAGAKARRNDQIRLFHGLRNTYPAEAEVRQGVRSESDEIVTNTSQPARAGQRILRVAEPQRIDPLLQVVIRSSDGGRFEAYCIEAVEEDRLVLSEELDFDYAQGSRVVQGRLARELTAQGVALQRAANCCCCCGETFGVPFAWWWFVAPGLAPTVSQIPGTRPPSAVELPPTPTVPRRP